MQTCRQPKLGLAFSAARSSPEPGGVAPLFHRDQVKRPEQLLFPLRHTVKRAGRDMVLSKKPPHHAQVGIPRRGYFFLTSSTRDTLLTR